MRYLYISTKPNIKARFPFKEDGLVKADILRILDESGIGVPKYYEWRSRSGCYFCFYQRKIEWVGLYENHPEEFEKAKQFEKYDEKTGKRYTWSQGESLDELIARKDEIKAKFALDNRATKPKNLMDVVLKDSEDDDDDDIDPAID